MPRSLSSRSERRDSSRTDSRKRRQAEYLVVRVLINGGVPSLADLSGCPVTRRIRRVDAVQHKRIRGKRKRSSDTSGMRSMHAVFIQFLGIVVPDERQREILEENYRNMTPCDDMFAWLASRTVTTPDCAPHLLSCYSAAARSGRRSSTPRRN